MFRMHRNNLDLIFYVYSNLTLLDTMVQKEFAINASLASNTTDPYLKTVTISTYDRNLYHTP